MLKSDLITLVNALRAENSTLTTQLAAARCVPGRETRPIDAVRRLVAKHPQRKSFTADEVRAEATCSA